MRTTIYKIAVENVISALDVAPAMAWETEFSEQQQ